MELGRLTRREAETVKAAVLDSVGVALSGSRERSARLVADRVAHEGGRPAASVFGRGFRVPAAAAALANATATHAELFDDNNVPMIAHPSACLVASVLALAQERNAKGAEVVAAYAAGFEVEVALGRWLNPAHYEAGWHATSVLGTVGAAAGAARLLRLDAERMRMALGMAASFAAGIRRNFGTMTMALHAGHAAWSGITVACLAEDGFESDPEALTGRYGFGPLFAGGEVRVPQIRDGRPLELTVSGIIVKPYPSGAPTHAAIDGVLALRTAHAIRTDDVVRVTCEVSPWNFKTLRSDPPRDGLQAKVSMAYCLARALRDGSVDQRHFVDASVTEPTIVSLMERIAMVPNEGLPDNGEFPARVTIELADGRRVVRQVDHPPGSPARPLSRGELESKFARCAADVLAPDAIGECRARLWGLEDEPSVAPLCRLLEGARRA